MRSPDLEPPLAWELHGPDRSHGDVTWKGGVDVDFNTGDTLRRVLSSALEPVLRSPRVGEALHHFFTEQLQLSSGGEVWGTAVPRELVEATLNWKAAFNADGVMLTIEPNARYRNNVFPPTIDPLTLLELTRLGTIVWEATHMRAPNTPAAYKAGSASRWVTLAIKPETNAYLMCITAGSTTIPEMVEQSDGPSERCDLGRLHELLNRGSDN